MKVPDKVAAKLKELPDKPGCYMMRDKRGRIIYVGKAVSIRKRVQSYFRKATLKSAEPKLRSLVHSVANIDHIVVRNEAEALLTEGRLIKDYRPRYNVSFKDDKRFLLLRVELSRPFPQFKLCRFKRKDEAVYFGPYSSSGAARALLDFLEKRFGVRKCSPVTPDAEIYKHCINDIVRYCSAPCIGKVTHDKYLARVEEACAFLRGQRADVLKELKAKMEEASAKLAFEKAAALRDTYLLLDSAIKQNARIASTPEMKREDAMVGLEELQRLLRLPAPPLVIEAFDVSNISGTYAVASMVCAVNGMPNRNRYRRFRIKTVEGADDCGMMAEVIRRRFGRLKEEKGTVPDLVLVDGGIGQVNAARKELKALELQALPVAGLAKKFEELHWPGSKRPIRLPFSSASLRVLQRIRDEAHRFALDYHRQLRSKCMEESALDEISGIGKKRKEQLLKHFGSIRRIMDAPEEQIAGIPGFGISAARLIKTHLSRPE